MKKFLTALLVIFMTPLAGLTAALEVGDPAPLFEATSDKGPVKLEEYQGRENVVLAFYFADFSPV